MTATFRRALTHALSTTATLLAMTASLVVLPAVTTPAHAGVAPSMKVLKIAASRRGAPYSYGATGPRSFDCSGFTQWVFARAGKRLPRTSAAQASATRPIPASQRRIGDLVFFRNAGRVYHVGIYAGGDAVWHSPYSGSAVKREHIWTRAVTYGRVR